jgi:uncharacterized membrane protein
MNKARLDALSDGIFAIIMTLLIIEIKVPEIHHATDSEILNRLGDLTPLFIGYILSFSLLYTLWRAHSFIVSYFAQNITVTTANLNALFLLFVCLIPFSAHFLGEYYYLQTCVILYSLNVILASASLFWLRNYIINSPDVKNPEISQLMKRNSNIRMLVPIVSAIIAIAISFFNTSLALFLLVFPIIFNSIPGGIDAIESLINRFKSGHKNKGDVM